MPSPFSSSLASVRTCLLFSSLTYISAADPTCGGQRGDGAPSGSQIQSGLAAAISNACAPGAANAEVGSYYLAVNSPLTQDPGSNVPTSKVPGDCVAQFNNIINACILNANNYNGHSEVGDTTYTIINNASPNNPNLPSVPSPPVTSPSPGPDGTTPVVGGSNTGGSNGGGGTSGGNTPNGGSSSNGGSNGGGNTPNGGGSNNGGSSNGGNNGQNNNYNDNNNNDTNDNTEDEPGTGDSVQPCKRDVLISSITPALVTHRLGKRVEQTVAGTDPLKSALQNIGPDALTSASQIITNRLGPSALKNTMIVGLKGTYAIPQGKSITISGQKLTGNMPWIIRWDYDPVKKTHVNAEFGKGENNPTFAYTFDNGQSEAYGVGYMQQAVRLMNGLARLNVKGSHDQGAPVFLGGTTLDDAVKSLVGHWQGILEQPCPALGSPIEDGEDPNSVPK